MESAAPQVSKLRVLMACAVAVVLALGFERLMQPFAVGEPAAWLLTTGFVPELYFFATGRRLEWNRLLFRGVALGALLTMLLTPFV